LLENVRKTVVFYFLIAGAIPVLCQPTNSGINPVPVINPISDVNGNYVNSIPGFAVNNTPLSFNTKYGAQSAGFTSFQHGGRGNPLANPGGMVELFANRLGLKLPRFRYDRIKGMSFQAGLITNSRQPKLGASMSMPRGFNISAGYGINSMNKFGYAPVTKNQGIQITAGYRLFGKK